MEYNIQTEAGFEEMYQEYFPKIYNYIFYRLLSREETEDLLSEIFIKAVKNAASFDQSKGSFNSWIFRIAKNTLINHYRSAKNSVSLDDDESGIVLSVNFEDQLGQISSEKRKVLYQELAKLSERERLIIYHKFFDGYNNRQIAMLLEMNESTVGTVLSRTLKKLRTPETMALQT